VERQNIKMQTPSDEYFTRNRNVALSGTGRITALGSSILSFSAIQIADRPANPTASSAEIVRFFRRLVQFVENLVNNLIEFKL
jgi:hypothetical protein